MGVMINPEEITNIANLSRLDVSPEEAENLRGSIESILGYISEINEIQTVVSENTREVYIPTNVMREDVSPHESGEYTEVILAEAPQREGQYFAVKKIM